jgi:5-methylcytosine-specific restriction endonuclease McrA
MSDVLVLNRSFFAIEVTDWRRALTLLFLEHAVVVDEVYRTYDFEDWVGLSQLMADNPAGFIHTPSFKIAVPEVIALRTFDHLPMQEIAFSRRNIYQHYGYRCCYCAKRLPASELNLDHVLPRSRGGHTDWLNVVTSCIPCNRKKGNKLPEEAGMKLRVAPGKPKGRTRRFIHIRSPLKVKASWQRFIDRAYWDSELLED